MPKQTNEYMKCMGRFNRYKKSAPHIRKMTYDNYFFTQEDFDYIKTLNINL